MWRPSAVPEDARAIEGGGSPAGQGATPIRNAAGQRRREALLRLYESTRPEKLGAPSRGRRPEAIGHFGVFRETCRDTLWREWRDWILDADMA